MRLANFAFGSMTASAAVDTEDYHITNPYRTVDWATFGQYKADFHSHSIESDGANTPAAMFKDHYLNDYEDKVDSYIRAQLKGAGGISFTQPFGINNFPEQMNSLKDSVESLDLNKGLKNSLAVKLDNALKLVGEGKNNSVNLLNAFINEVQALGVEGKLTEKQAAELMSAAEEIVLNITSSR